MSMRLALAQQAAMLGATCRSIHGLPRLDGLCRLAFGGTPDAAACGLGCGLALGLHHDADFSSRIGSDCHKLHVRHGVDGIGQGIRRSITGTGSKGNAGR